MLLPIHIAAGGVAIVLGAVALSVRKGGILHRRAGRLFVYAMLVMGFTASLLGLLKGPDDPNVPAFFMTAYFVVTALMTVRRESRWSRWILGAGLTVIVVLALRMIAGAVVAFNSPGRSINGVPFGIILLMATVYVLAAAGDVRVLWSGMPRGGRRLARHLWRMCFALFVAAASFFSVPQRVARILPEPFATLPMRMLPILLVVGAMFYWLWKVRRRRAPMTPQSTA